MKTKNLLIAALLLLSASFTTLNAQTVAGVEKPKTEKKFAISDYLKISGNLDLQYDYENWKQNDGSVKETNTFNMRRARLVIAANITKKLEFKFQAEFASSPKVLDAYLKWNLFDQFQIRIGQGKIPFTIENPYAPSYLTIENTQVINALSGMTADKLCPGTSYSGGREMGVAVMGGFIKRDGFSIINYNIGIFNGNGINVKNDNLQMAYVGQLEIKPIRDLKIHGSAYLGSYNASSTVTTTTMDTIITYSDVLGIQVPTGYFVQENTNEQTYTTKNAQRNRFAVGAEYASKTLMIRSEYVWGFTDTYKGANLVNQKSDGFYAQAAYNIFLKGKKGNVQTLIPVIRYDYYAANSEVNTGKSTYYLIGLGWWPEKHFRLQVDYTLKQEVGKANLGHSIAAQATVKF